MRFSLHDELYIQTTKLIGNDDHGNYTVIHYHVLPYTIMQDQLVSSEGPVSSDA